MFLFLSCAILQAGAGVGDDDELQAILAKEAATIKRALNLGSDQEWAVDIGKPVKEAWAVSSQVHWFALV
eukprot:gene15829-6144_t